MTVLAHDTLSLSRMTPARLVVTLVVLAGAACTQRAPEAPQAHIVERARPAMGSELRLTAWTTDETAAVSAFDAVFGEFDRLEDLMSVWREGSDIQRLMPPPAIIPCRSARRSGKFFVSHARSASGPDGRFDVTFAALSGLWKFDYQDKDNTIPDRARGAETSAADRLPRSVGRRARRARRF